MGTKVAMRVTTIYMVPKNSHPKSSIDFTLSSENYTVYKYDEYHI